MKKEIGIVTFVAFANLASANQWADYAEFEVDATNAIANISVLISDSYTNRLHLCRSELGPTNEISSAALLLLALSDDAKSNHVEDFIGNTNWLGSVAWFLTCPVQDRTLWQKICAITILSTGNKDPTVASEYFNIAVSTLQQWDALGNCFQGGVLYQAIAQYFGSSELNPRMCLIFAAAVSAKKSGMTQQFNHYSSLLPSETRAFLANEIW